MSTPSITPQAIGAFLILVVTNVLILFGLDIGANREAALDTLINGVAVLGFLIHDAVIRHGRSRIAAAEVASGQTHELVKSESGSDLPGEGNN